MKLINKVIAFIIGLSLLYANWNQYNIIIREFKTEAERKEYEISRHVDLGSGFMELMRIYGEAYIHNNNETSEYFNLLVYDEENNNYHIDVVTEDGLKPVIGSLTGLGMIPKEGIVKREILLALQLNSYFKKAYELIPGTAWLYYTSTHNFVSLYPWISPKEFFFSEDIKQANFFAYASPLNNPDKKSVWTPVYFDYAGKGLMVTYSCPLYYDEKFLGVISLDFASSYLGEVLHSEYHAFLADQSGGMIASNNSDAGKEKVNVRDAMGFSEKDWRNVKNMRNGTIQLIGNYYIYKHEFANAPWTMYFRIPIWKVIVQALKITAPTIAICFLFIYALYEIEKRRHTEKMLSDSLKERKEYQELLENAAKYDFLTSTLNRRGMEEKLSLLAADTENIFIIMGDMDWFKDLNDTYGHNAGDKVLVDTAEIMKRNIDPEDLVCRWGGEEFLLILLNKTKEEAKELAERIRRKVEEARIPWNNGTQLQITITLGLAELKKDMPVYRCIANADNALYYGKRNGRNQVVLYSEDIKKNQDGT